MNRAALLSDRLRAWRRTAAHTLLTLGGLCRGALAHAILPIASRPAGCLADAFSLPG